MYEMVRELFDGVRVSVSQEFMAELSPCYWTSCSTT